MVARALLVGFLALTGLFFISPARAEALFDPSKMVTPPSRLFPILPDDNLTNEPNKLLSRDMLGKIYDRCMSQVPDHFTPEAHKYYCTCSSAATQANMTRGEIAELQKDKNRVTGNATFEKYVSEVMAPCMDLPVDQIEYLNCALNTRNDPRITDIPQYCKCTSLKVSAHASQFGLAEMMLTWGNGAGKMFNDPIGALWENNNFQEARSKARDSCVSSYVRPNPFKD